MPTRKREIELLRETAQLMRKRGEIESADTVEELIRDLVRHSEPPTSAESR